MIPRRSLLGLVRRTAIYLPAASIAAGLKFHYSRAGADQLSWILRPTAQLVSGLGGRTFQFESGTGWVTPDGAFIIAPACAGVNFMILLFGLGVFLFLHRFRAVRWKCIWHGEALLVAYGATILVNTLRILVSIRLYQADIYGAWITPDRLHRVAGIVVYFCALWLIVGLQRAFARRLAGVETGHRSGPVDPEPHSVWSVPLGYGMMTLLIPLLNGAFGRHGSRFAEHAAMVATVCLAIMTAVYLPKKLLGRLFPAARRRAAAGIVHLEGGHDEIDHSDCRGRTGDCRHHPVRP